MKLKNLEESNKFRPLRLVGSWFSSKSIFTAVAFDTTSPICLSEIFSMSLAKKMNASNDSAIPSEFYLGRRISYGGALCTVRYHGSLPGTKGAWLGVEWDDPSGGKHDGTYQGTRYFECLSSEPTAGSFIRPSRTSDSRRSFLDALRFKYAGMEPTDSKSTAAHEQAGNANFNDEAIEISGKVVEEVGFERIRKQQAVLQDLRIVLLDELCLAGITVDQKDDAAIRTAQKTIGETCPNIVELDLGWNVIETWSDIAAICLPLRKLQVLKTRYESKTWGDSVKLCTY